jgi:hypothetical protein
MFLAIIIIFFIYPVIYAIFSPPPPPIEPNPNFKDYKGDFAHALMFLSMEE